ncbi:MAG: serine hydrolase [Betaproteobacteria bacterium]|nr:serine hydrolase [Betaproteobacteria bacterium]
MFGVMRFLCLALLTGSLHAAPDEAALGKADGYPVCPMAQAGTTRCLIGTVSRGDEGQIPSRRIQKGATVTPLKRAASEPALSYSHSFGRSTLDEYLSRNRTTGLLVLKGDTILVERYQYERKPEHRMASYSMAKTIVAMLVGIALQEGSLKSIDDRADAYVPALKGHPYGETPLRHLLSMSSGVSFTENYSGRDDVSVLSRIAFNESPGGVATVLPFRDRVRRPGERFSYASAETQVLGLVLRAATGKPLAEYASEKIWQPMGAEADASWFIDKGGNEIAYAFVNASLRDYARLGMMLANDGAQEGRQIIPAAWVTAATTPPAPQFRPGQATDYFGYGYQTWLFPGEGRRFQLRGLRGQVICVDPATKVVVVHTAAREVGNDPGYREQNVMCMGVMDSAAKL